MGAPFATFMMPAYVMSTSAMAMIAPSLTMVIKTPRVMSSPRKRVHREESMTQHALEFWPH